MTQRQSAWHGKGSRLAQFALIAMAAGEFSAAVADVLVLRSMGPSASRRYPAGQRVPDATVFTLRPGDSLTVLTPAGTRIFNRPGTYTATGAARGTQLASGGPRSDVGTQRGPGDPGYVPTPTDIWQYDVGQSGRVCVPAGALPTLWRGAANTAVQITITPQSGRAQTLTWPAGQSTLAWPAALPFTDGASYQLMWTGAAAPSRLTARSIQPLPAGNVDGLATALIANQCRSQLDFLIAQHEVREAPAPGAATTPPPTGNRPAQ